ncbi:hypothetical protein EYC80_004363 [Monilinia laxa]|uniref:Uncharacterized protein n=1 Tax=Monilinia laxa TaxID=61186 RepID=A0A5N6KN10_MONLA|nr:hypothetical protein EYC80_004363 [Monilinia laxa]
MEADNPQVILADLDAPKTSFAAVRWGLSSVVYNFNSNFGGKNPTIRSFTFYLRALFVFAVFSPTTKGVAATGICTSAIIDVEAGAFACSVATTSTAGAPVPSSSVYDELPTTDKGRRLKVLRRLIEDGLVML